MKRKVQEPAEGVSKMQSFNDTEVFKVSCNCGCEKSVDVSVEIEVDTYTMSVHMSSTTKTNYWYNWIDVSYDEPWLLLNAKLLINDWFNRFNVARKALLHGYVQTESDIMLTRQQAVNFAGALRASVTKLDKRLEK